MARKKLRAGDQCNGCSGTGMSCLRCSQALDDCECGAEAEPCTCELCDGRGFLDEFMADCQNAHADSEE